MAKIRSKKGKGLYAKYRSEKHKEHNRDKRVAKIEKRLSKRKEWRIMKYNKESLGKVLLENLSGTTLKLFQKWGLIKKDKTLYLKFKQERERKKRK